MYLNTFEEHQNSFNLQSFFIGKLLIELGVFPSLSECLVSGHLIKSSSPCTLLPDQGGFALIEEFDQENCEENS